VSHTGEAEVPTLDLEVLLATKLRALYQRRKGQDLFDLHVSVNRFPALDLRRVLSGFRAVMEKEGYPVSWREFEINLKTRLSFQVSRKTFNPYSPRAPSIQLLPRRTSPLACKPPEGRSDSIQEMLRKIWKSVFYLKHDR
jgi:hypothetical protein